MDIIWTDLRFLMITSPIFSAILWGLIVYVYSEYQFED